MKTLTFALIKGTILLFLNLKYQFSSKGNYTSIRSLKKVIECFNFVYNSTNGHENLQNNSWQSSK